MQTVDRVDTSVDRKIETLFPALELDGFASEKKLFNPLKRIGTFESGLLDGPITSRNGTFYVSPYFMWCTVSERFVIVGDLDVILPTGI